MCSRCQNGLCGGGADFSKRYTPCFQQNLYLHKNIRLFSVSQLAGLMLMLKSRIDTNGDFLHTL